jgi:hypothetical protein
MLWQIKEIRIVDLNKVARVTRAIQGNQAGQGQQGSRRDSSMNEDQDQNVSRQSGQTGQDDTGLGRNRQQDSTESGRTSGTEQNQEDEEERSGV